MKQIVCSFCLVALATFAGCTSEGPRPLALQAVDYDALVGWGQETQESLIPLLREECRHLAGMPPEAHLGGDPAVIPNGTRVGDWSGACTALASVGAGREAARQYLETWFQPYAVDGEANYTGYFEPEFQGSLTRGGDYQVPVYARPRDLVRAKATDGSYVSGQWVSGQFRPYASRAEIDSGRLDGQGLELLWLRSPVDLFFLQIQGSGRVVLPDGRTVRLGFAARNGQAYVPIGRVLVRRGDLAADQVSMQTIRDWLAAHPDEARSVMEENPNYVFFRRLDDVDLSHGAPGAFGVALTPGRSLAVDRGMVPFAAPVWVETRLPDARGQVGDWRHLTLAQDIGTDIRGAGRGDLFTGWGAQAQAVAGGLHEGGRMVLLLPHPPA